MLNPAMSKSCRTSTFSILQREPIEQHAAGSNRHALCGHDRDVEPFGYLCRVQQRPESFLFDKDDVLETIVGTRGRVAPIGSEGYRWPKPRPVPEIAAHLDCPERNRSARMRLDEMAAGVEYNIPISTQPRIGLDEIR